MKEVTLLLLGETGVGKSTWINGFANFHEYESLEDAEKSPTLCFIPASFTMTDENYEERLVSVGSDVNEVTSVGQSATQQPSTYTFTKDNQTIRIIDTPGIGDVRGVEQDKKNFKLILNHISHLEVLDGICILLKPNNARLNIMFTFCIKELLTNLHRDACRNIRFCFTNSRSTFYRPGDTLPALKKLIAENKDVEIPLNQSTLYCMDNESIRFLYALKSDIKFTEDERKNYAISWEKSVFEVGRLLTHIGGLAPHQVKNTLSLNNARQTILALGLPIMEISRNVQTNIALSENKKMELITSQKSKEELAKDLTICKTEVKKKNLEQPRTICTNASCVDVVKMGPVFDTNFKSLCHAKCSRGKNKHYEMVGIVGHKSLKKCSAFEKMSGRCKTCGCSWKLHMKILHETWLHITEEKDAERERQINKSESAIQKIEKFLSTLDDQLKELREEQNEITSASAKFACFLKKNAITPYNDSMLEYISHFINEEHTKVGHGADSKVLEGLKQMKKVYEQEMKLLEEAIKKGQGEPVSPVELDNCVKQLYSLKHCGQNLQELMYSSVESQTICYTEKKIERIENYKATTVQTKSSPSPKATTGPFFGNRNYSQSNASMNKGISGGMFQSGTNRGPTKPNGYPSQSPSHIHKGSAPPLPERTYLNNQKPGETLSNGATTATTGTQKSYLNETTRRNAFEYETYARGRSGTNSSVNDTFGLKAVPFKSGNKGSTQPLTTPAWIPTLISEATTAPTRIKKARAPSPPRQSRAISPAKPHAGDFNNSPKSPLFQVSSSTVTKPSRSTRSSIVDCNQNTLDETSRSELPRNKVHVRQILSEKHSSMVLESGSFPVMPDKSRLALLDQIRKGTNLKKAEIDSRKPKKTFSDPNMETIRIAMMKRAELMRPTNYDDEDIYEQIF